MTSGSGIEIIYDGECPFCARYVALVRLREAVGRVALIDARSGDPRVSELQAAGHDLDEEMIVRYRGEVYSGAAAVSLLTQLSRRGLMRRVMQPLFSNPRIARVAYRALAAGRRATLRLLGRPPIRPREPERPE